MNVHPVRVPTTTKRTRYYSLRAQYEQECDDWRVVTRTRGSSATMYSFDTEAEANEFIERVIDAYEYGDDTNRKCPTCGSSYGYRCMTKAGYVARKSHWHRYEGELV